MSPDPFAGPPTMASTASALPPVVDRAAWQERVDALREREKAHTREGDAIAAERRRLPMVEVDPATPVVGAAGEVPLLEVLEGRSQLFAAFAMWHDVTFAVLCEGPFDASDRYRRFMGWEMPWYAVPAASVDTLVAGRHFGMRVCYLRDGDRVFETYWTTARGCEHMGSAYAMLDMTVHGRQEAWEDSPAGWPRRFPTTTSSQMRTDADGRAAERPGGRPIPQWARLAAGHDDDLGADPADAPADHAAGTGPCCR
ncbi:DUF899 family protein [Nocardioides zeae]|uniref:DUF899 family protein n=1 Tax=Nocardioides imazamoxiresistens TaxID=3231893 RepID=A0ABU3PUS7_9ACTN|nr:DUF899 family protein [Nocardioides zeae]MDT9592939.1 DUF899 family protein [Nocardioides zeae]